MTTDAREQWGVDETGRRTAVILSIDAYEQLMEDLHDLAVVAEWRDEPTVSLADVKRRLQDDGLLPR